MGLCKQPAVAALQITERLHLQLPCHEHPAPQDAEACLRCCERLDLYRCMALSVPAKLAEHCAVQNMSFAYLQRRPELVHTAMVFSQQLHMKDEVAHDAILLMDRTMSTSLQVLPCPEGLDAPCCLSICRAGHLVNTNGCRCTDKSLQSTYRALFWQ